MKIESQAVSLTVRSEPVAARATPLQALALADRRAAGVAMLHSAAGEGRWGRWTILAAEPLEVIEAGDAAGPELLARLTRGHAVRAEDPSGFHLPFCGGWIGYLGFEAASMFDDMPVRGESDVSLPRARFGLYGAAAVYDHASHQWHAVAVDWPGYCGKGLAGAEGIAFWRSLLTEAQHADAAGAAGAGSVCLQRSESRFQLTSPRPAASVEQVDAFLAGLQSSLSDEAYMAAVARAVRYIEAGDIYQVNLARRLTAPLPARPLDLYMELCRANPAWYGAYLALDGGAVLSSSPELFLEVSGDRVITRPIKGTRPRVGDARADEQARRELWASEKDRAELTMIIDLERNDLGRVCRFGSVRVVEPFALEAHPTVYHLVGTIEGRLRSECGLADLLAATFPGGSITGAPKIRAMEIIRELEPVARSVYCGGIGWIGLDGQMRMNVAIRTLIVDGLRVHLYVGGGIVADSRPELELQETVAKARGMARALLRCM